MPQVDQFESVFRSAVKDVFEYRPVSVHSVLLVTDLDRPAAQAFRERVQGFLSVLGDRSQRECFLVTGGEFSSTEDVLNLVDQYQPDLVCTYRNLHSQAWRFPHSLGEQLDVLLQQTTLPVMILPHPQAGYEAEHALQDASEVMVVTDRVAIDHNLINYAVAFTHPQGTLFLTHVEDEDIFERYMDAISKIDVIDTELARERLKEQLLKEPEDYFDSCALVLEEQHRTMEVKSLVTFGHSLSEYRHHIESQQLDLLVLPARDERQQAMNSLSYPLAVELRQIPLLMV